MSSGTRGDFLNLQIVNVGQSTLIGSSRESLQISMKASSGWKPRGWEVLMKFFDTSKLDFKGRRTAKFDAVKHWWYWSCFTAITWLSWERINSLWRRCFSRYQCQKGLMPKGGCWGPLRRSRGWNWAQSLPMPLLRGKRDVSVPTWVPTWGVQVRIRLHKGER